MLQFESLQTHPSLWPLAHAKLIHASACVSVCVLISFTCGPGLLFVLCFFIFIFWLPLICGHSVTASCRPAGISPLYRSCSLQPQPFQKNQDVMEYLLFDCLTTSENSSNSRKTPRNADPEEEKPCQNQLLTIMCEELYIISFGLWKSELKNSWDNEVHAVFNQLHASTFLECGGLIVFV